MSHNTQQRLIESGYDLFARNGFHAIGMDRIFAEVGVSKQTFYNHFESKDDFILAVLQRRSDWEMHSFEQMLQDLVGDDPRKQIEGIWDVLHQWFNHPDFRGCIFLTAAAEFPAANDPAHIAAKKHNRKMRDMLADIAARAGATDPMTLADLLMVLVDGALVTRHVCGNDKAADLGRRLARPLLEQHLPKIGAPALASAVA